MYVRIDERYKVPDMEKEHYSRYINFRPGDGEIVHVTPPRFSWGYLPEIIPKTRNVLADQKFTLQISKTRNFKKNHVEVKNTSYKFYNTLKPLKGARTWYWRVGYDIGTKYEKWSHIRRFTIHHNTAIWDRSSLAKPDLASKGHPRILFNSSNLDIIRDLRKTNDECKEIAKQVKIQADKIINEKWWINFPDDDKQPDEKMGHRYYVMVRDAITVAFAYILFRDLKYLGFKERMLRVASWPKGGYASPEGAGPVTHSREDDTQITEFLGLFYDWFYHDLTGEERENVLKSLEWRIDHAVNNFSWRRDGKKMGPLSIALQSTSHQYEALMVTLPGALATYEHSSVAREAFKLGVNYLIGVTNGFGFYEGWNEGLQYGTSKMKWLMNATIYFDTVFPSVDFAKNPFLNRIGDFIARIAPVGVQSFSFGNYSSNEAAWVRGRVANFRKLAYLTSNGIFLKNWRESRRRLAEIREIVLYHRPWIEYILPYYYCRPEENLEKNYMKLFKVAGWVTVNSRPPSSYEDYYDSVGMTFHCRPRGGYSHSFFSENSFNIHAYGQVIVHGGGTTKNGDQYSRSTMSHNTILVDGVGQYQDRCFIKHSRAGFIAAWYHKPSIVYWIGDATNAYESVPYLNRFRRHVLFVRKKYFIIFDDLQTNSNHPSNFQWLYHIEPDADLAFDKEDFEWTYQIGRTCVKLKHIYKTNELHYEDRQGLDGLVNPITGEDYRENYYLIEGGRLLNHNLWISNLTPKSKYNFLAAIFPYKSSESEPLITKLDDLTLMVEYKGKRDTISFDINSSHNPNIVIDYKSLR